MDRKGFRLVTARILLFVLIAVSPAFAAPSERFNWGQEMNSGPSPCPSGPPVINVVQKVVNDDDSGVAGNAWALDDFVRQIKVVDTGGCTFCATVSYQGSFTTLAGPRPVNTGTDTHCHAGTFEGGGPATHL